MRTTKFTLGAQTPPRQSVEGDGAGALGRSVIKGIQFPDVGRTRSRKVVTRSRARVTGKYPSWKMERMLQWESPNELNAFRLLDCIPEVVCFTEQPCEIQYLDGEIERSHFPDVLVEMHGRKEFWEVKPESEALKPDVSLRSAQLARYLPAWGYSYRVVLAQELSKQPRLRNANQLLRFGRREVSEEEHECVRLALKRIGALSWSEACAGAYGVKGCHILCRLTLEGVLAIDLNATWSESTQFVPGRIAI